MKNAGEESSTDSGVLSNPLSFLRNGLVDWSYAGVWGRGLNGYYWSLRSANTTSSNYLYFYYAYLGPQHSSNRGQGLAVRCVSILFSKSFTTLFNTSYSMKNCTSGCEAGQDAGALSNPLSLLRSGAFYWGGAGLYGRGGYGYYWSLRSADTTYSSGLNFDSTYLNPQYNGYRGQGFAVRCVQILHHSH